MKLRVAYDRSSDVLYVNLGHPVPIDGDGLPRGVELDFAQTTGVPVGVTVIGYLRNEWYNDPLSLAEIIGKHLSVDPSVAITNIEKAVAKNA